MPKLDVISFDLDQTLFDFDRTLREALQAVSTFLATEADVAVSADQLRRKRNELSETPQGHSMRLLALRRHSFACFLEGRRNKEDLVAGAMRAFEAIRFKKIYLYQDAESVLIRLAKTYRLVAVTNGNSDPEDTALSGVFEHVVFAEDCGVRKPDVRIFRFMMQRAGVEDAASVCHVGDSLTKDVQPGNAVGFSTIWFNPRSKPNDTGIVPAYEITSLRQLPPIIDAHVA